MVDVDDDDAFSERLLDTLRESIAVRSINFTKNLGSLNKHEGPRSAIM